MNLLALIVVYVVTTLVSLSGGLLLLSGSKLAKILQKYGPVIAVVVLLYAVFGDIVPEVLEENVLETWVVAALIIAGVVGCAVLGKVLGHFHHHGDHHNLKNKKQAYSMFAVDTVHTAADGVVLGAAFAAGIPTGIISALATAAHEIPQEIGDFAIMLRSKMEKEKIIKLQFISAAAGLPVALVAFFVGDKIEPALPPLLCVVAGFLLYIAIIEIWSIIKALKSRIPKELSTKSKE